MRLQTLLTRCDKEDIFNADETGLALEYKSTTLALFKKSRVTFRKFSKNLKKKNFAT